MSVAEPMRAHALLSASGSGRWLACPPSAHLEQQFPDETSEYAAEGAFAHELAEMHLRYHLDQITKRAFNKRLKEVDENPFYSEEMCDHVKTYVDFAVERINEARARTRDAVIMVEQRLDFSPWVRNGFGTGDLVTVADGMLEIMDLKYGKGVPVSAEDNPQMRLYALGAINQFGLLYDIQTVQMIICQPRLDNISSDEIAAEELVWWAVNVVRPLANLAFVGQGKYASGSHCRFCRARHTCRTRAEANLDLARYDFKQSALLTDEEVGDVLTRAEELQKWAKDISDFALDQAENHGKKWPGWKLVSGRSNRKYADEEAVTQLLLEQGFEEDVILPRSLLGITAMEKAIGKKKFTETLEDLVIKPAGRPTLVPISDKRPEISSAAEAAEDFK